MVDEAIVIDGVDHRGSKHFRLGTHRTCSPEETIERARPHYHTMGITRVADVSGLDEIPIATVIAHRPNSRSLAAGAGKGFTKALATASAVMEAAEFFHAEFPDVDGIWTTHAELTAGDRVVAVEDLPFAQHAIFSVDRAERWIAGWELNTGGHVHVPMDLVDLVPRSDFSLARNQEWRPSLYSVGSTGLASGNVLLEAVLSGLYECIERDAVSIARFAARERGAVPFAVDLEAIEMQPVRELIERLRSVAVELWLYDVTSDVGIPTYMAEIDDGKRSVGRYGGYGTHLDPEVAMIRAITEAVQSRLVYIAGSRDDLFDYDRDRANRWTPRTGIPPARGYSPITPAAHRPTATDTLEGDAATVLSQLRSVGLDQVIVVDLTKPGIDIPVVRVVVPGCEAYPVPSYQPGRRAYALLERLDASSTGAA